MSVAVARAIERTARRALRDIKEDDRLRGAGLSPNAKHKRYGGSSVTIDRYGQSHVRGAAFTTDRCAYGITKADISAFRSSLRKEGVNLSFGVAEATLLEIQAIVEGPVTDKHQRWREKQAQRRQEARKTGICIVCIKNPADTGCSTCWECQKRANERKKRRDWA